MELIDGKNVSRAKMLLKVDSEFLRRTLPLSQECYGEDLKQLYVESIDAMKMLSFQKQGTSLQNSTAEMKLLGLQSHDSKKLVHDENSYSASGYRSNEIDEK